MLRRVGRVTTIAKAYLGLASPLWVVQHHFRLGLKVQDLGFKAYTEEFRAKCFTIWRFRDRASGCFGLWAVQWSRWHGMTGIMH